MSKILPIVEVSPAIVKAAEAAWSRYRTSTPEERPLAYRQARAAEQSLWAAQGALAAFTDPYRPEVAA